jgi:hypothetical protein
MVFSWAAGPASSAAPRRAAQLLLTCHAEPKWSFLADVRRGPGTNWGILRQFVHDEDNTEFRVIGRDAESKWYQVIPPEPHQDKIGWAWHESLNVYGNCLNLPITEEKPEITPDEVPPLPRPQALPDFAAPYLALGEFDRVWQVTDSLLYLRYDVPGEEQKDRIQAHVLVMNLADDRLDLGVTIGAVPAVEGVPVSKMAADTGALAAINGDFYAGNYFPQGITVIEGQVVTAPKLRAAFGLSQDREPFIGYFTMGWTWPAYVVAENGEVIPLQLMNVPCDPQWLCMYTHHRANRLPEGFGGVRVLMDENFEVVEIIRDKGLDIPDGYSALLGGQSTGDWLLANVEVGDTLEVVRPTDPPWENFESVISGGPRLLIDEEIHLDCYPEPRPGEICEEFTFEFRDGNYGLKSLPRSAVGYNEAGLVYIIMVEGYEVQDSGGMTRQELADLFLRLGATQAMEFDGGGSSSLVLGPNGRISDVGWEGERRVSNALLVFWEE